MLTSLSLRLRVFLFFAGIALLSVGVVGGALYLGHGRATESGEVAGFLYAGILSAFGILAISVGIWLLFDENVAKPIERLASSMRVRAHSGADTVMDMHQARYLGDLAPASEALSRCITRNSSNADAVPSSEAERIAAANRHLSELLTKIPVAIVLINSSNQIVLYDGQAAEILAQVHVPRLGASIFDYFSEQEMRDALGKLTDERSEVIEDVPGTRGNFIFNLRVKELELKTGYIVLIDDARATIDPAAARPLTFDFDLSWDGGESAVDQCPLKNLSFVVIDTETTGLMPNKDEIVQIGAVRVVNGRPVAGEVIDQLVNPGRAIPPASTKVHGISDAMVADAPPPQAAVSHLHAFAQDSVLVAHNAPFDIAFLKRHGEALGQPWDHPVLDTVLLSAVLFGAGETHTLDALCERLDITIPEEARHTALGDAVATAEALCKMLPILSSRGFDTFGAVVEQTRKYGRLLKDLN